MTRSSFELQVVTNFLDFDNNLIIKHSHYLAFITFPDFLIQKFYVQDTR